MNRREYLLKPFEDEREYMEGRVQTGIEARKADACVTVRLPDGTPVPDASVRVRQRKHAFFHGANLFMLEEMETPEKNAAYREAFARVFNMATLPFYWADLEPEPGKLRFTKDSPRLYRRPAPDLCLEYCDEKGVTPKLHCLNYDQWTPLWVDQKTVPEIKRLLEKRFSEIGERYADKIHCVEVINETLLSVVDQPEQNRKSTPFFFEDDLVDWSFKAARRHFPKNELIINEAINPAWDVHAGIRSPYPAVIAEALRRGASIDGIGLQYHLFVRREHEQKESCPYLSPKRLYQCMDFYANRFHMPLQVTEITLPAYSGDAEDEALQAELLEKLYTIWFSHPAMEAAIYWNLVDGYAAFAPQGDMSAGENYYRGGLMRFDMTKKPAYDMLEELFHHRYVTCLDGRTERHGALGFRGFEGEYDIAVEKNGHTLTKPFALTRGNNQLDVILEG